MDDTLAAPAPSPVSIRADAQYTWIATGEIMGTLSPRQSGECAQHVAALAQSSAELPPIVVHRPTMKVVDGMHRLRAAQQLGFEEIRVHFVDGSEADAFVLAVEANVRHGLPLTLADRRDAAARVLETHPEWSDRRIALSTGLAPGTVASVRRRAAAQIAQLTTRVGRDNRRRSAMPLGKARRRSEHRRLGAVVGVESSGGSAAEAEPPAGIRETTPAQLLATLRSDPSVRLNARGRDALQVLTANNLTPDQWVQLPDAIPAHQASTLAQLATHYARRWHDLAQRLREASRKP